MRDKLLKAVRILDTDYEPYGKTERAASDCSSGCRHFAKLAGDSGEDWGVCTNPNSLRAGLLTYEHQGCAAFESILLDRALTDAQLRTIIGEASEILKDRRREHVDSSAISLLALPTAEGEFFYEVRTKYLARIRGHFPSIFRLEPHDHGFVAIPLEARSSGKNHSVVMGRYPAKNGEIFKIVRENGAYSYQVPFNGELHNLKQYGTLPCIGFPGLETLRRFLESVEVEIFEKVRSDGLLRLKHAKRSLEESQDNLERWRKREFRSHEIPKNKQELREMLQAEEAEVMRLPTTITETEAFIEWLKGIDRSNPTLRSVPPPPSPKQRIGKR